MQCWGEADLKKDWYRHQSGTERAMNHVISVWSRERAAEEPSTKRQRSHWGALQRSPPTWRSGLSSVCLNKNRHPLLLHCLISRMNFQKTLKNLHFLPLIHFKVMGVGAGAHPRCHQAKAGASGPNRFSHRNWSCLYWCCQNRKKWTLEA